MLFTIYLIGIAVLTSVARFFYHKDADHYFGKNEVGPGELRGANLTHRSCGILWTIFYIAIWPAAPLAYFTDWLLKHFAKKKK